MSRSLLSKLRSVFGGSKTVRRPADPARRPQLLRPGLEDLEGRLVPASLPLHAAGGQLQDSAGRAVVLRGVNLAGLESGIPGAGNNLDAENILRSADVALNTWHANLLRVTVSPDFWFGHDQKAHLGEAADGGAAYRNVVSQIVAKASAANAYVMLTDYEYWNNLGEPLQLKDRPTPTTTSFWSDPNSGAARLFANNPAVMFDPFNEPQWIGWDAWQGSMQPVLDAIRGTGANNVVSPNGMGYAHDLSGVAQGKGLSDPAGNLMYQLHLYPAEWQSAADGDATVQPVAGRYPVYIGEFGVNPDGVDDGYTGVARPSSAAWTQNMITWANQRGYSWTAWSFTPDATPVLFTDWNYTPTSYFGTVVKNALAQQAPSPPAGPANDSFANRAAITGSSATVTGTSVNATREAGEPTVVGNGGGHSVWWTWTAPASGSVTLTTAGSNFDTLLGVYTGTSVAGLAQVTANDDVGGGVATSTVTFNAVAGTAYQIAVDGYDGAAGNVTLNVALTPSGPANNNFVNRAAITGATAIVAGSNVGASREAGEPTVVGNGGGHSVWWTWTAPASGSVTLTTAGSNFDTLLGVYTGSSVSGLTLVGQNDDVGGGVATSTVTFNAVAGTAYQIAVDGYDGAAGNVTLNVALTPSGPANDSFARRATITGSSATVAGTSVNATREAGEPSIVGNGGGHSVWWTWTAPTSGTVTVATAGSNFDTLLGVYRGSSVSALTLVAANDDVGGGVTTSIVTFNVVAGTTYQLAVDGYDGAVGNITLGLRYV